MIRPPRKLGRGDSLTAAHYNALLDFVRRIMPLKGANTSVDYTMGGARINAGNASGDAAAVKPWTVRWNDAVNALEVYIPSGTVQLSGCTVHLVSAGRAGWYVVHGSANPSAGSTLVVTAHVKGRVREGDDGAIHPVATVTAAAEGTDDRAAKAGDVWSVDIARCESSTPEGEDETPARTVVQLFTGTTNPHPVVPGLLELYWATAATAGGGMEFAPHVEATSNAPLCGKPMADTAVGTGSDVSVYYIVDCSGETPVPSVGPSDAAASDHVSVLVYRLSHGMVVSDLRASLENQVYYP